MHAIPTAIQPAARQQLWVPNMLLVARLFQALPRLTELKLAVPAAVVFAAIRFWCVPMPTPAAHRTSGVIHHPPKARPASGCGNSAVLLVWSVLGRAVRWHDLCAVPGSCTNSICPVLLPASTGLCIGVCWSATAWPCAYDS
jgi:hypothetical protein